MRFLVHRPVEIEISVLSHQRLERCIRDPETLSSEIAAWEEQRHAQHVNCLMGFKVAKKYYSGLQLDRGRFIC